MDSIEKEYKALKLCARAEFFTFNRDKAKQKLRPYQSDALANLEHLIGIGKDSVGVQLPTGAGKTFLIHAFIHKNLLSKGENVLVICPSWEIANQHAATVCQQFKDGCERVARLGGNGQLLAQFNEFDKRMKGMVVLTTSALFYARNEKLKQSGMAFALVVIDEGHHGWKKKRLNSVQTFAREISAPSIFLTATPPRNMENLPFAAQIKYLDLVPDYLVKCDVVRLDTGQEFNPILKNGILTQAARNEISSRETRYKKVVADSLAHMQGQTIYYAGSVREASGVAEEFTKHGISVTIVHSKWPSQGDKINALAIDQFRRGKVQVLVNVQMLAMGFDVPNVETIIVARPVESDTLFTQMVGRGARPAPDKDRFILIDVHDTIFKPEVAKIFEHKHLFYADVSKDPVVLRRPGGAPLRILRPPNWTGFPYHEGQMDDRTLVSEAFAPIETHALDVTRAAWRGIGR